MMSVEVKWLPERDDKDEHEAELEEGGVSWMTGYGDEKSKGTGKETCVVLNEGVAKVVCGKIIAIEYEEGIHVDVEDAEELAVLPVGVPYAGRVFNDDGDMALFFARNLGDSPPEHPGMKPAWN